MITRYEYGLDSRGEWRWTAYASNGEPIAVSSEGYRHLADCLRGIELMKGSTWADVVPRAQDLITNTLAEYSAKQMPQAGLASLANVLAQFK